MNNPLKMECFKNMLTTIEVGGIVNIMTRIQIFIN